MDPNALRACVETAIMAEIDFDEWDRCAACEKAEQESCGPTSRRGDELRSLRRSVAGAKARAATEVLHGSLSSCCQPAVLMRNKRRACSRG